MVGGVLCERVPMMKRYLVLWTAGLLGLALGAADLRIEAVSGDVQARGAVGGFAPAQVGTGLGLGAALRTGNDGRATVGAGSGNQVVVQPESALRVEAPEGAQGPVGVRLVLETGRVESALTHWPAGMRYEVASAAGTFVAHGTTFAVGYRLGPAGEFIGGTEVGAGEVEYIAPECSVPSLTAGGGMSVLRTLGLESVMLEITANGNGLTVVIAEKHRISVAAGTTVRIGMALRYLQRFAAIWVQQGVVTVGDQAVTPADRGVFIASNEVLPNEGGIAFLEAVRTESGAHAQAQLPGLTDEQLAALHATQQSGARAVIDSAVGAGVLPMYQPPFVPERPLSAPLSPSGTP